ncbi:class II aldolase/adducin family protein [Acuticoccus mangrovi]|uniref:Class II aldolase/adducin family protein n=1 Tax=Acuticoccus mangrovi TaxID=2796142 RepID=A0A934ILX3_9HYPH|nr:class II aldolase/adducin family protein [Acuticoccus mangrovi]MBJ3774330.1 class II aldolase/adducin family protein [Acuticoccus mangrovi]
MDNAPIFEEATLRVDLAAAYRLLAHYGLDDMIYTHTSVRLPSEPGKPHRFLINPYGMQFDEIRASDLVVVDPDGYSVAGTDNVNPAGFTIHSAIHMTREDAMCVMHTHTLAGMAVSALKGELLMLNQMSMEFYGRLAYHDYEGIALDLSERERLQRDLGTKPAMILKNHGLLTVGRTVAEAFYYMYYLEMACRIQLETQKTGAEMDIPPEEVIAHAAGQFESTAPKGTRMWPSLLRKLDRIDMSYRD